MEIRGYRVIYLDPEEDINSLLAELNQANAERLALVVHGRSNMFTSKINIQLLERYLKDWKKELVFISPEERLIRMVLESKLKIYPDLEALERDELITDLKAPIVTSLPTEVLIPEIVPPENAGIAKTEEPPMLRSRRRQRSTWRMIAVGVVALLVLVGLGWVYFSFPMITVEVSPSVETMVKNLKVTGELGLEQIKLTDARIPLQSFKSYDVQSETSVATTGRKRVGFTRAEGTVTFVNNQSKAVQVSEGTVVKTSNGTKFKTVQAVTVPALTVEYMSLNHKKIPVGNKAGRANVAIVALEAGTSGNVGSGQITQFAEKNAGLVVVNQSATRGGTDKEEMVVVQADLDKAMGELEKKLKALVDEDLSKEVGQNYIILKDSLQFEMNNVEVNHHVDEYAQEITAKGQMVATGYLLMKDDLRIVTREMFLADLPAHFKLRTNDIEIQEVATRAEKNGSVEVNLKASALVEASIDPARIVDQLKGQTVEYANGVLSKMKEIKYFRIRAGDKARIPALKFAIRVVVNEPEEKKGSI